MGVALTLVRLRLTWAFPVALAAALVLEQTLQTSGVKALFSKATEVAQVGMAFLNLRLAVVAVALVLLVATRGSQHQILLAVLAALAFPRRLTVPQPQGLAAVVVAQI